LSCRLPRLRATNNQRADILLPDYWRAARTCDQVPLSSIKVKNIPRNTGRTARRDGMPTIKYNTIRPGEKRTHYIDGRDVDVLLSRLPHEVWSRLRAVHFNDRSVGCRRLGYVNLGHREIAICALPPRVSLTRFLVRGTLSSPQLRQTPAEFGAARGRQWPLLAIRRFMLYDVFLHELGHLQIVMPRAKRLRRRFASETKAREFANDWRRRLWSQPFDHDDPVHNPPSKDGAG
jgi:hypothetical protein